MAAALLPCARDGRKGLHKASSEEAQATHRARLSFRMSKDTSRMICCPTFCDRRGLAIAVAAAAACRVGRACQRGAVK